MWKCKLLYKMQGLKVKLLFYFMGTKVKLKLYYFTLLNGVSNFTQCTSKSAIYDAYCHHKCQIKHFMVDVRHKKKPLTVETEGGIR